MKKYSFILEQKNSKKSEMDVDLKKGFKKLAHGIGYVMQKSGKFLEKNSQKISKGVEKGTEFTLNKTGKAINYIGQKSSSI